MDTRSWRLAVSVKVNTVAAAVLVCAGIGAMCASAHIQDVHIYRVAHECDGALVLPASGFVFAWVAAVLGLGGLVLAAAGVRRQPLSGWAVAAGALLLVAIPAFLLDAFAVYAAYGSAGPIPGPCSG